MSCIEVACEQRSPEWHAARLGVFTASDSADIMGTLKSGKEPAARRDLRVRLALERVTGQSQGSAFVNADMQRGIDREPDARLAYEASRGVLVREVGFLRIDGIAAGCSPDGLVDDDGLIEVKCPRSANHFATLLSGEIAEDYRHQIQHQLWVSARAWCDYVSFDPAFGPKALAVVRVTADALVTLAYEKTALAFLAEVEKTEREIRAVMGA